MTLILSPFDGPVRLRRRSPRTSTGQVYYGHRLRALLDADRASGASLLTSSAASASDPGAGCREPRRRRLDDHVLTLLTLIVAGAALGAFIVYGPDLEAWARHSAGAVKLPIGIALGTAIGWCARRVA